MQTHYLPDRKSRGKLQEKRVRIPGTGSVFLYGGSSGLRCCLASIMSRRVRFPRPPPIISLKCYLVAFAVWGRRVLVRIQVGRPVLG